ncbi:MAG: class I SAM-dependent methyltransferase [Micropruina sp.]
MDAATARWLTGAEAAGELARAAAEPDPGSLGAAERLRRRLTPERAAAVSAQIALRRRARTKFGERADRLFFTPDGLEQATRPAVAAWRAGRLRSTGVRRVLDLGCGLGADALACVDAGLEVAAIEADEVTAILAGANLGIEVTVGDAVELLPPSDPATAVFCDPARRSSSGRSWRVEDLNPPWSFVEALLVERIACVKLGPGLPHALIPDGVLATWVSERGDLVELSLWSREAGRAATASGAGSVAGEGSVVGPGGWGGAEFGSTAGRRGEAGGGRCAVLLPGGVLHDTRPVAEPSAPERLASAVRTESLPLTARPEPGAVLYEPDPAVIRAGLVNGLAERLAAVRLRPQLAYLLGAEHHPTPFATAFEVLEVLDAGEKTLRAWVRRENVGTLEIKKRGLDIDPATLRRRLKPTGRASATLVLTPTADGVRALVVRRLPPPA